MPRQPLDYEGNAIPCLTLKENGAHKIDFTDTAAKNSVAFAENQSPANFRSKVVTIFTTVDCYIKFGDATVVAVNDGSDHFYPAGFRETINIPISTTHVSVIRAGATNGTFFVSERD